MQPQPTSRREFLRRAGAVAVLAPSLPLNRETGTSPEGEEDWQQIRKQFLFREEKVPMNAANLCPSPRQVAHRVEELTRDIDVDCSFPNRQKFSALLEESRRKVAELLGVTADEIALVRNTSEGNNIINNGLALRAGDEVVVWSQNHPTNHVAWQVRAARFGFQVVKVATPARPGSLDDLIGPFEKALSPRTRVLALTHVSNLSGVRLPIRELCEIAHRREIYVHVDGAQTWGALDVNLRELGCDSYAASAHKWFCGPKEAGLLYVKGERIPEIWPSEVAPGWGEDVEPDVVGARKFESMGQRDDACLAAVGTAADFHRRLDPARVERRVLELAAVLKAGLQEAGGRLVTPEDPHFSAGVCIVEIPEEQRQRIADRLYHEFGIAGAPTGGLRLCPHLYNTREHVERAIRAFRAIRL